MSSLVAARAWLRTAGSGFCSETELDNGVSCARGRQGSWALQGADGSSLAHATAACLALCRGCPRCRYISVAKGECGWFAECELDSLVASYIPGMPAFRSGLVVTRNATDEDDAPWSSEAAVASRRDAAWPAALEIFEPLVATPERLGAFVGIGALFGRPHPSFWSTALVTLRAWRRSANASLVVLTDQARLVRSRVRTGRRLIVQPVNVSAMAWHWRIAKRLRGSDSQWYRHLLLATFLRLSCGRVRGVLLLDVKDVLVQRPPWALLSTAAAGRVVAFEEVSVLRRGTWNARILAQFGRARRAEVESLLASGRGAKVINSGVILGAPGALLRHVDAMIDELWRLGGRYDRWMVGVDQAAHMLVVHRHAHLAADGSDAPTDVGGASAASAPPTFEIAPLTRHAEGAVLHVTDVDPSRYLVDELGTVRCAAERRAYVAVHQWNRAPPQVIDQIRQAYSASSRHMLHDKPHTGTTL